MHGGVVSSAVLDFFFVSFFCVKTKERKGIHQEKKYRVKVVTYKKKIVTKSQKNIKKYNSFIAINRLEAENPVKKK